jgi:hypothetical protein
MDFTDEQQIILSQTKGSFKVLAGLLYQSLKKFHGAEDCALCWVKA